MPPPWHSSSSTHNTYTTVAQTEDPTTLTTHGKTSFESQASQHNLDDSTPTPEDLLHLPRIPSPLPLPTYLLCTLELCERFAYYGLSSPFQNYISVSLALGQARATALTNGFTFWCYVTPLLGAILADEYVGKYHAIMLASGVYMVGIGVLVASSLVEGWGLTGLIVAMGVIGLGTGGIKSNVAPLIAEQVPVTSQHIVVDEKGRRSVVDHEVTMQRVFMMFYMCINVGSITAVATVILEAKVGFWAAFALPLLVFIVGFVILVKGKSRYIIKPPQGGVIGQCVHLLYSASRNGFSLDAAALKGEWDDAFVAEVKTALGACKVFAFFPVYWLAFSQMANNFVSQASSMALHGLPNDILPTINPLTIILLIPICTQYIYPFILNTLRLPFPPVTRITAGFVLASLSMLCASILQSQIYSYAPAKLSIAWQVPLYPLLAASEILASITGLELAYSEAPEKMKSLVMSLFLLTSAGGSVLGVVVSPVARDPWLGWMYLFLAVLVGGTGVIFWRTFGGNAIKVTSGEFELQERSV